jgi:hypothetical protein
LTLILKWLFDIEQLLGKVRPTFETLKLGNVRNGVKVLMFGT